MNANFFEYDGSLRLLVLVMMSLAGPLGAQTWSGTSAPNNVQWSSISGSSDGVKLVAASGFPDFSIYQSTDAGGTWKLTTPLSLQRVISSSDATRLCGRQFNGDGIYLSSDGGFNWTRTAAPQRAWLDMAASTNCEVFWALGENGTPGPQELDKLD